jgi:hypothetical protein
MKALDKQQQQPIRIHKLPYRSINYHPAPVQQGGISLTIRIELLNTKSTDGKGWRRRQQQHVDAKYIK